MTVLAALALLAACETYDGPAANCFGFTASACDFAPVAGSEGVAR